MMQEWADYLDRLRASYKEGHHAAYLEDMRLALHKRKMRDNRQIAEHRRAALCLK